MSEVKKFFTPEEQVAITTAIHEAENNTSGEIRVHLEFSFSGDVLDRAAYIFKKLEMHKTAQRNGVLFYLAVKNRQFAIIGDAGINQVVGDHFWDEVKETMLSQFKNGKFAEGLTDGIKMAGLNLKTHFPYQKNDVNELSDEISYGNS